MNSDLEKLRELYIEASLNGMVELEDFLENVRSGEHFTPSIISEFLDQIEGEIIENMYIKLEERPELSSSLAEKIKDVHEWIGKLKEKYG